MSSEELPSRIDAIADGTLISGVMLDSHGMIVEVSSAWRERAERLGLQLPNYGIGSNYLQYCLSTEDESLEIYRGLRGVLKRTTRFFSSPYSCSVGGAKKWNLLIASAYGGAESLTTVLHIDLSGFLNAQELPRIETESRPPDLQALSSVLIKAVQGSIADALGGRREIPAAAASLDKVALEKLSARQAVILKHMARGLSNAEIAAAMNMSLSSTKVQAATIIRKLNLRNRTQAALFAARAGFE